MYCDDKFRGCSALPTRQDELLRLFSAGDSMTMTRSKDVQRLARCGICNLWRNLLLLDLRCWLFGTRRRRAQRCRHARNMSVTSMKVADSICVPHHSLHKLSFNFRKASFLLSRVSCVLGHFPNLTNCLQVGSSFPRRGCSEDGNSLGDALRWLRTIIH